jgi:NADPH-dependent 2,4-dienoyl-CoA reductase/sulfur reductase-like enzyme
MNQSRGVVIVGASVAGMHAAERLREYGYGMRIDLIEVETRLPYDRPPLSKSVLLGKATHEDIRLHGDGALAALGVELHRGVPATELRERSVCLADGREFPGSECPDPADAGRRPRAARANAGQLVHRDHRRRAHRG